MTTPARPTCGAKTRAGGRCLQRPMENGRCRLHGGMALKGPASPQYQHGRYSKYLPSGLSARAAEMSGDPDLLSLRAEIGVVDALTAATMEGIDLGAALRAAAAVSTAFDRLSAARARGDTAAMARALDEMGALAQQARQASAAVDTVLDLLERRRRLVDTERRRLEAMEAHITAAEAFTLVDAVVQSVQEHVVDREAVAAIADDLARILGTVAAPRGSRPREIAG